MGEFSLNLPFHKAGDEVDPYLDVKVIKDPKELHNYMNQLLAKTKKSKGFYSIRTFAICVQRISQIRE